MFRVYFHLHELGVYLELRVSSTLEAQRLVLDAYPDAILMNAVPVPIPNDLKEIATEPVVDNVVRVDFRKPREPKQ